MVQESHLIVVSYFHCGAVFESIDTLGRIRIIEKWLGTKNGEALSILALLVNQLLQKSTHLEDKERYFKMIRDRISDPDWIENYEQAIEMHREIED